MKKIGILGGSFDPIHQGHLNIAQSAYHEFKLDEVWFIPAGHSPNKDEQKMTPAHMRAEMTALAICEIPYFKLSRIEIDSDEISYTYLTLTKLTKLYPNTQFFFILGADSLDYLERWRHPEIICEKAIILAAVRDGMNLLEINEKIKTIQHLFPAEIYPITNQKTEVSSSCLRLLLKEPNAETSMIPYKVMKYIRKNHLYENSQK